MGWSKNFNKNGGTWFNVEGTFSFECGFDKGVLIGDNNKKLPKSLDDAIFQGFTKENIFEPYSFEVVIPFKSSGCYDKGDRFCRIEDATPPYFQEDRELDGLAFIIHQETGKIVQLSKEISEELFSLYESEIMNVCLEIKQQLY